MFERRNLTAGLTTTSCCQVMVIAIWLRSALRPRPTARAHCDVCLLFITALSSLFPRHLIRPDYRVIAIYPTAASDSCMWRRRDEVVRKTFAFFVTNFKPSVLCIRKFYHDFDIFVMNETLLHVTRQFIACFVLLF